MKMFAMILPNQSDIWTTILEETSLLLCSEVYQHDTGGATLVLTGPGLFALVVSWLHKNFLKLDPTTALV